MGEKRGSSVSCLCIRSPFSATWDLRWADLGSPLPFFAIIDPRPAASARGLWEGVDGFFPVAVLLLSI